MLEVLGMHSFIRSTQPPIVYFCGLAYHLALLPPIVASLFRAM
jgi:hypothetical protein